MGPIVAVLLSILALSSATALQNEFFTSGKEVEFQYVSHVTVRTDQPASFISLYGLQAKMYVQKSQEDTLMVRLDNIVFDLENGPLRVKTDKNVYVPIPMEAEALSLPFAIKYDSNKLVTAVIVDTNDKEWSYNIKKSIASILQFNTEVYRSFDRKVSHVEYSREQTLYGLCNVTYNVLPHEDHVTVVKTIDPRPCDNKFNLKRNANFLNIDSNRVYKINQKDNKGRLEMIEARGDFILAPYRATTEMESLKVHQRFVFVKEVAITNPLVITNQLVLRSLKYEDPQSKCRETPLISHVDITGGRSKYNNDVLVPKVHLWLDQLVNLVHEDHITLAKPDSKVLQLLQKLYAVLEIFDLSTLEHTFALLQEKSQSSPKEMRNINLFVQLLPHVGTRSSAVLIRNLIRKQKIDETMAVRVLRDLPAHLHCPNEKLLIELEDMLTLGKEGSRVHRASVLAFASLIKRTFLGFDEKSVVLDKYNKLFMKKLTTSQDYNIQVLYVHALANVGFESVVYTLAPILTGEMVVQRNLRSLALWAVAPLFQKNHSLMIKFIWPILSHRKLDISLRTVAYDIYVRTEKPTLNRFMQLYWLMRDETNERFYNFHYNTLVTISQLRYAQHNENQIMEIARTILRMSRHPIVVYENEGIFVSDFIDQKSGLGGQIDNLYSFGSHINIRTKIMSRIYGHSTEMLTLQVGIATPTTISTNDKESVLQYVEFIIRHEGRIVMTYAEDEPSVPTFLNIVKDLGINLEKSVDSKVLEIPYLYERVMPTDFGVPIRMYDMLPHIQSIYFKMDTAQKENMKFDFQIKSMSLYNRGFKVYNPINDLWHGIEENKHIDFSFGFSLLISQNAETVYNIKVHKFNKEAVNGVQVHTENVAYIKGESAQELLSQFHKDSLVRRSIIRGEDYITNDKIYDTKCNTLGHHIEVKVFDCDRDVSRGSLITRLQEIETEDMDRDNFISIELLRVYLSSLFQRGYGSHGYGVRFTPLETFDHIEFNVTTRSSSEQKGDLKSFGYEIDVEGATKSVENVNLATYNSKFNVNFSEQQRHVVLKWWIVHNDQVNKERKLDIDLRYLMKEDHFGSKLILSLGEVDKLGVITFDIKGTRSEEQERILKERKITYDECRPEMVAWKYLAPVKVECAVAHSSLNHYVIDVTANDVENRMVQMVLYHFNTLRHHYSMYAQRKTKTETNVMPMHLDVVFPVFRKEWDVTVDTPRYTEVYTGLPQYEWSYWGLDDISLANIFFTIWKWGSIDSVTSMEQCVISKEHVLTKNGNYRGSEMTNEWTLYLKGSTDKRELYDVYVKKVNGNRPLAIQVKIGTDTLEIMPQGHELVMKVNNVMVTPVVGKYTEEGQWNYLMVESPKMMMFSTRMHGLHIIYDGRTIRTMTPSTQALNFEGHCVESEKNQKQIALTSSGLAFVFIKDRTN
ncbi:uncharacterized protein LOC123300110 [Chrysoperla carnea]|uniref:uncharacterized protein LOC123300110 n=1 Tax=Chrysoperla carnea TaxID=189513 RepID=UPI001D07168F|nr:uncharacterized protein LOC123300110 [Chrysoperla carnea]